MAFKKAEFLVQLQRPGRLGISPKFPVNPYSWNCLRAGAPPHVVANLWLSRRSVNSVCQGGRAVAALGRMANLG